MSSEEQNLPDAKDDLPNDEQGIELSLDQLSQAYAQVMREQGASEDEPEIEPLDVEGTSEEQDDDAPETQHRRPERTLEEIDAEDNEGCPISPKSIVESILFVGAPSGVKLTARILASAMRDVSPKEIKKIVKELNDEYQEMQAPYQIVLEEKCYKLKLQDDMVEVQNHFFGRNRPAKLSQSAIDVLAIVAYNQPVSRSQVDKIRTRPSGGVLNQLVRRDLLETEVREKPKEIHFRTTDRFLTLFGLGNLDDLPQTSVVSDLEELSDF